MVARGRGRFRCFSLQGLLVLFLILTLAFALLWLRGSGQVDDITRRAHYVIGGAEDESTLMFVDQGDGIIITRDHRRRALLPPYAPIPPEDQVRWHFMTSYTGRFFTPPPTAYNWWDRLGISWFHHQDYSGRVSLDENWSLRLSHRLLTLLPALITLRIAIRVIRREIAYRRAVNEKRCPACGYDMRATPDRCPECGGVPMIDPERRTVGVAK